MTLGRSPLLAGASSALLAALSFGVTAPLVALSGRSVGPFTTACLLYAGAAVSSLFSLERAQDGAPLTRAHGWRLALIALLGATLAPTLLAWGLGRVGGLTGSLLLNLEGAFTVLLAWLVYREPIGPRVRGALALMSLGGALLGYDAAGSASASQALGVLAVTAATLTWALDNTLSRELSQQSPLVIVTIKGGLGALLTAGLASAFGEHAPSASAALWLLACGASGYGLSLRWYLRAQRRIGAARTGSIFSVAPFIGAALGLLLGERGHAAATALAALCFGLGLWLHFTERHQHPHRHEAIDHDHPHRHDDGHHDHPHDPQVSGEHSHPHHHDTLEHEHEHAPDLHHEHRHS
jgi:drug/metabolite transporter (DMT)-like permease